MKTKPCSKCQLKNDKPNQRYCKKCHAEYMRLWRLKEKEVKRRYEEVHKKYDFSPKKFEIDINFKKLIDAKEILPLIKSNSLIGKTLIHNGKNMGKIVSLNGSLNKNRTLNIAPALLKGLTKQEKTNVLINLNSPYFMVEEVR